MPLQRIIRLLFPRLQLVCNTVMEDKLLPRYDPHSPTPGIIQPRLTQTIGKAE